MNRGGVPPMAPPPPGAGGFPAGSPNDETFGPTHPVFNPSNDINNRKPNNDPFAAGGPNTHLPPGSVPPGASFDPIGPPGANSFRPNNDHMKPPK